MTAAAVHRRQWELPAGEMWEPALFLHSTSLNLGLGKKSFFMEMLDITVLPKGCLRLRGIALYGENSYLSLGVEVIINQLDLLLWLGCLAFSFEVFIM